jgi:hypothetical protein
LFQSFGHDVTSSEFSPYLARFARWLQGEKRDIGKTGVNNTAVLNGYGRRAGESTALAGWLTAQSAESLGKL